MPRPANHHSVLALRDLYRSHFGEYALCLSCFAHFHVERGTRGHFFCRDNSRPLTEETSLTPDQIEFFASERTLRTRARQLSKAAQKPPSAHAQPAGEAEASGDSSDGSTSGSDEGEADEGEEEEAVGGCDSDDDSDDPRPDHRDEPFDHGPDTSSTSLEVHVPIIINVVSTAVTLATRPSTTVDLRAILQSVVSTAVIPSTSYPTIAGDPAFQSLALLLGIPQSARTSTPWQW